MAHIPWIVTVQSSAKLNCNQQSRGAPSSEIHSSGCVFSRQWIVIFVLDPITVF